MNQNVPPLRSYRLDKIGLLATGGRRGPTVLS
jgi:hypothetical protein